MHTRRWRPTYREYKYFYYFLPEPMKPCVHKSVICAFLFSCSDGGSTVTIDIHLELCVNKMRAREKKVGLHTKTVRIINLLVSLASDKTTCSFNAFCLAFQHWIFSLSLSLHSVCCNQSNGIFEILEKYPGNFSPKKEECKILVLWHLINVNGM